MVPNNLRDITEIGKILNGNKTKASQTTATLYLSNETVDSCEGLGENVIYPHWPSMQWQSALTRSHESCQR